MLLFVPPVTRFFHPDLTPLLVAVAESPTVSPAGGLVQYGAVGLIATAAITGLIYFVKQQAAELNNRATAAAQAFASAVARGDRLETEARDLHARHAAEIRDLHRAHAEEIRDLHRRNVETVIPALAASHEAIRDTQSLVRDSQQLMRDLARGGA